MKLSIKIFLSLAIASLSYAAAANAQQGVPVWTDILNIQGQSNMASGTFFQFSNLPGSPTQIVQNTSIVQHPNLTIPGLPGTPASGGGFDSVCSRTVSTPTQYLESYFGSGIKGVGFLGTFGGQSIPGNNFGPGASLFEAVFFNERQCYNGGREYGFFYDPYGNGVWVYWGTNENLGNVVQAQLLMTGVNPNTEYYYEMYPTGNSSACGFQVTVLNTGFGTVYSNWLPVNANNFPTGSTITGADASFCGVVTSSFGEAGFVSANAIYAPTISNMPPNINLNMQRVFVGK